jgi:hypothetical protein
MTAFRLAIAICEWVLISLCAIVFIVVVVDFAQAWNAQACSSQVTPTCYPWGWFEGPLGGPSWGYASKNNYLVSGLYLLGISAVGVSSALWLKAGRRIYVLLAGLALLYIGQYLLPLIV